MGVIANYYKVGREWGEIGIERHDRQGGGIMSSVFSGDRDMRENLHPMIYPWSDLGGDRYNGLFMTTTG